MALAYNAADGTVGMSKEGDVTLFYRAFDYDRYPVPTDVAYGEGMRTIQLTHHSRPGDRLWQVTWNSLGSHLNDRDEALRHMGHAARVAIRRNAGTYLVNSADDVRALKEVQPGLKLLHKPWTVTDLLRRIRGLLDEARLTR